MCIRDRLVNLSFANQVTHRSCPGHDLMGRYSAAGFLLKQSLSNDGFDGLSKLGANLCLLVGREDVDDAVDRLGCARSMQSTKNNVTGFRSRERKLNGLKVAHFADQNDIRVFTQRCTQRIRK